MNKKRLEQENLIPEPKTDFKEIDISTNKPRILSQPDSSRPASVASPLTSSKLLTKNGSNFLFLEPTKLKELLKKYESIMQNKGRRTVYFYFLDNNATTGSMIMMETGLSEQGSYHHMKWLHQNGFIEAHGKIRGLKQGGPRPILYALPGTSKEQLARSILKIRKNRTQSYKLVLDLTQLIWEDIQDMETQMSKIISISKKHSSGFHFMDVATLVARELKEKGVTIWTTG